MMARTEKDLWVEMSIREISTQARFAGIAYSQLDPKARVNNDAIFSSIHSIRSVDVIPGSCLVTAKNNESFQTAASVPP